MKIETFRSKAACGLIAIATLIALSGSLASAQTSKAAKVALGSKTAKDGFRNETEIANKFKNWQSDEQAPIWLAAMGYKLSAIESVNAAKPHGEKADVQVKVKTKIGEKVEGISIKLVSTANGFNQIDKRWVSQYVKMWEIPSDVAAALSFYVGHTKPNKLPAMRIECLSTSSTRQCKQR